PCHRRLELEKPHPGEEEMKGQTGPHERRLRALVREGIDQGEAALDEEGDVDTAIGKEVETGTDEKRPEAWIAAPPRGGDRGRNAHTEDGEAHRFERPLKRELRTRRIRESS